MFRVRQLNPQPCVQDVALAVQDALGSMGLETQIRAGDSVAIAVGSRGIAELPHIVATAAQFLRNLGARPFVVPAMGSHGGATPEGQAAVLTALGITPERIGCEVRASMDTVYLGRTPDAVPVHWDREAASAQHILVCNRVRPHASFRGAVESGLLKMLVVGLGNYQGARHYHRAFDRLGFEVVLRSAARTILARRPVLGGLAIVENSHAQVAVVKALPAAELEAGEEELLLQARGWLPRFPFSGADLLIVDEMGKNISGTGLDRKVIGPRWAAPEVLLTRVLRKLSLVGQTYWRHVLRGDGGGRHRRVGHVEFVETFARKGLSFAARALRRPRVPPAAMEPLAGDPAHLPAIATVFARSLTAESLGNATGLDGVDLCTQRLLAEVDWRATLLNGLASGTVVLPRPPRHYATDRQAVDSVLAALSRDDGSLRVVRIRSTARLQELEVSEAYLQEVEARSDLAVSGQGREMSFDGDGNLLPAGWRVEKELCA
jgi:hypothetical protein